MGRVDVVAIESTGAYAAGLVRYLREHDIRVLEVNQPHAHTRRRRGKSDPIDAELAARLALAGKATTIPKQTDGIVESIRLLRVTRAGAVKARSAAMVQLSQLIITAPQQLREQLAVRRSIRGKPRCAASCAPPSVISMRRRRPPSSRCDHSRAASNSSTWRSPNSTTSSSRSSHAPHRARPSCWASAPVTPDSCSSPLARTSNACTATARSPRSAAQARSPRPPDAPRVTASTTAATATPTARCT